MNLDENKRTTLLEALKNTPDDPKLLVQLAGLEFKLGCIPEALDKYKQAAILGLRTTDNKINIVKCFFHLNKFKEANVAAEQIVESGDGNAEFYSILCKIAISQKKFDLAEEYYGLSVDMDDSFMDTEIESKLRHRGQKFQIQEQELEELDDHFDDIDLIQTDFEEKDFFREIHAESGFDDIDGLPELKEHLNFKVIQQDSNPELYKKFNQRKGGSILLYGPTGCGKKKVIKALSFESGRPLYTVGNEDFGIFKNHEVRRLLTEVYQAAGISENCLLLFNNFNDLFGSKKNELRSDLSIHFHKGIKEAKTKTPNIYTIATSNAPWDLNRENFEFDKLYFVPPPMKEERKTYLQSKLSLLPASSSLKLDLIAENTFGFTYHDLKELIDKVSELSLLASLKNSKKISPITSSTLMQVATQMKASSEEWLRLASIHGRFGPNKELFNDVFYYLKHRD